ncbi:Dihydropteridine reductase [Clonorchis sinensis]|uniref:Dihydropteridine reductase n=1 Tax=Clonorchis sinensis TaxID=79923 RepID=A0A8T1ML32_CLOSI|nr:Dihydropteridine reductase [Clonorchis sinensis]
MSLRRVLVYGGTGGLGSVCAKYLKEQNFWVCSVDFNQNPTADLNVILSRTDDATGQHVNVQNILSDALGSEKLNAILCVAGGWAGGNAAHKDFMKNMDLMWKSSVWSSCIASCVAAGFLAPDGILVLTGAQPALEGTPGMLGYGMAKAAVHQLTKSLAAEGSGLPAGAHVTAILPIMLDTPMNRKWMPKADRSTWTPLETLAKVFMDWIEGKDRPASGSLIQVITKDGLTEFVSA